MEQNLNSSTNVEGLNVSTAIAKPMLAVVFRPKNGHELINALKENKQCEIVDTHAFLAAKALEDNHCGFSFSFKLSKWNKGWAGFERF